MVIIVEEIILRHMKVYPLSQAEDLVFLIYQAAGGEKTVQDEYDLMRDIELLGNALTPEELSRDYFEKIGGGFCRMNLSVLREIPVEVLGEMEIASKILPNPEAFKDGIKILTKLCDAGKLPFSAEKVNKLTAEGIHYHSREYVAAYSPKYRVVREEFCKYLDVFIKISRLLSVKGEVTVAIDGQSGAGKTTLSKLIAAVFNANIFSTECFMNHGIFDYISFSKSVCEKLNTGRAFTYYNPEENVTVSVPPRRLNIIEGIYSMHPSLDKYYEFKIMLKVSPLLQSKRILRDRGEDDFVYFTEELIPRENAYIEERQIDLKSDLVFTAI